MTPQAARRGRTAADSLERRMLLIVIALAVAAVAAVLACALLRLRRDETAVRRLRHSEYQPLVKHIWWQ
jgi:hypothetical protein